MFDRIKILSKLGPIWEAIRPTLILFLTALGRQVLTTALAVVADTMKQTSMSGSEKKAYAYDQIKQQIDAAPARLINIGIEFAVNKLSPV